MKYWLFPKDFTVPHSQADIREGGRNRSCLRAPDGTDNWVGGVYKELTPPEKTVFSHAWQDEAGNAEHETLVTITLKDLGGGQNAAHPPPGVLPERSLARRTCRRLE